MGIDRQRLERTVAGRGFALADFAAVALSATLFYFAPHLGAWPLLLAMAPWVLRMVSGQAPFRRTVLDLPLLVFMITALVGVWAAYDPEAAWAKFLVLASAVLLFYAIASQPPSNLWMLIGLFGLMGTALAMYFLLTFDWAMQVVKFEAIHRLGRWWMALRPDLGMSSIDANRVAGVLAMTIPLLGVRTLNLARKGKIAGAAIFAAALALSSLALVLTSSRGAWIALAAGLCLWGIWLITRRVAPRAHIRQAYLFGGTLLVIGLMGAVLTLALPWSPMDMLDALPGPPSASSRLQLAHDALDLIGDYPLTGGGLHAFAGLYSQYILNIPHLVLQDANDLYLNIALEQGPLGLLAFAAVLMLTILQLVDARLSEDPARDLLRGGLLAGLAVMLVHGLVTDALYGIQGTPMLFLFPALTHSVVQPADVQVRARLGQREPIDAGIQRRFKEFGGTALVVGLVAISLRGAWLANLGAVEMAKVELSDWPTGAWDDGSRVRELAGAEALFAQALAVQPTNRTARHRMGLICMLERDYQEAIEHLEVAQTQASGHRGIRKALGQSYAWAGRLDQAYLLLAPMPESAGEMAVYVWWWGVQDRADLAAHAEAMSGLLSSPPQPTN